jgi:uroporphyrinogen-III synthase
MRSEGMPLSGKRIVVTRAREQAEQFARRLEELGARVVSLPTIDFAPVEDTSALDRALATWDSFDWLILTSQNAVRFVSQRARELGITFSTNDKPHVAAVGPETARTAAGEGFTVNHVTGVFRGAQLAKELGPLLRGQRVLLPRSDLASQELPQSLAAYGAILTDVVAYRTLAPRPSSGEALEVIRKRQVDAVAFASPSAFRNFVEILGEQESRELAEIAAFVTVGPTTSQAVRAAGIRVAAEAKESTMESLLQTLQEYFAAAPQGAQRP